MEFVRTLAAKSDFDAGGHGLEEGLEEHDRRVEIFTVPDQVRQMMVEILRLQEVLVMLQVQGRSDGFGRFPVGVLLAPSHGPDLRHGLTGPFSGLMRDRGHQRRIKASGEHDAHWDVGHEPLFNALNEGLKQVGCFDVRVPRVGGVQALTFHVGT